MKDSLRDFIDKNRESFDNREPSNKVWDSVKSNLKSEKSNWWNAVSMWRAAAIVFMGLSGYLFVRDNKDNYKADGINRNEKLEVVQLQGEFSDLENFYSDQIEQKVELINEITGLDENDNLSQDLSKLDAMYQVLREQMKTNPSEKVKDALILNMLVRIDLLNQQIHQIEKSKQEKKDVSI